MKIMYALPTAITSLALAVAPAIAAGPSSSSTSYTATPFEYIGTVADCGAAGTPGGVSASWEPNVGNPGFALSLQKNVPTSDCSSAGATINGVENTTLTELNFDYKGYCGAGAPRFNVYTTAGTYYFFGCAYGTHTPTTNGYTHVQFSNADAFPADGTTAFPGFGNTTVTGLEIVQDEQGQVLIDNISVNGQVITGPSNTEAQQLCKKDGYKNFTNPGPFKNQGDCVSYFATNGRNMPDGQ